MNINPPTLTHTLPLNLTHTHTPTPTPKMQFDHEKLSVYQQAIEFIAWSHSLTQAHRIQGSIKDQLERASVSVALNIAEGNGKSSPKDRKRFLEIAKGSSLECAAVLDVLAVKKVITDAELTTGKDILFETVAMLFGLIKRCQKA